MTSRTIFRIASMTKPITSAALMQLVEQHRIGLDDRADKYLPAFKNLQVFDSFDSQSSGSRVNWDLGIWVLGFI